MINNYNSYFVAVYLLFSVPAWAQVQSEARYFNKKHTIKPEVSEQSFDAQVYHLEAPVPGGNSRRGQLREKRVEVAERTPQLNRKSGQTGDSTINPIIDWGIVKDRTLPNGIVIPISGGIPNDNTLAVSNGGILLSAINFSLYAYDVINDSALFPQYTMSLSAIAKSGNMSDFFFDPKLLYDPEEDRFILTFLANTTPERSFTIIAFSVSNNPLDGWHVYFLPGNPLNNNRWTDYPSIIVTKNELICAANFIIPVENIFGGSLIWQIDKHAGYAGDSILPTKFWHGMEYEGNLIYALFPVVGKEGIADEIYLLSNKLGDLENDTFFIFKITGELSDPQAIADLKIVRSSTAYAMPPNGRQQDTDPNDPTTGLDINDLVILGAFLDGNHIQFVHNCRVPNTGNAGVYHGFIRDLDKTPSISGNIFGHPTKDLGYPNIAWTGVQNGQPQAIIAFNHTSVTDFAGVSAIYFSNDSTYSEIIEIQAGLNYVSRISGPYDRWGDYSGIQRVYNKPNEVYTAGFLGLQNRASGTYLSRLLSPDTSKIYLDLVPKGSAAICKGIAEARPQGGIAPYSYKWLYPNELSGSNEFKNLCEGDSVYAEVSDSRGHIAYASLVYPRVELNKPLVAFPNPFEDKFAVQFRMPEEGELRVFLYNVNGQLIEELYTATVKQGLNELVFEVSPLRLGTYIVKGFREGKEVFTSKVIRAQ